MKNAYVIELLNEEKEELKRIIKSTKKELEKSPPGSVQIRKHGKGVQFYHRRFPGEKNGIYISAADRSRAVALVQKRYLQRLLKAAEAQLSAIVPFLRDYDPAALTQIYDSEGEIRKRLLKTAILSDEVFSQRWQEVSYDRKPFREDAAEQYTLKNERVRSKSEVIIANTLYKAGIPYRYEYPLAVGNQTIYPDFTILRIKDRKELLWEHLGMMDDREYRDMAFRRIRDYESDGYFPGRNLIITFETNKLPLHHRVVESMIQQYLL